MSKSLGLIIDLDGTLCNVDHRLKYVTKSPKDWHSFHQACSKDEINPWCQSIYQKFYEQNYKIIFITGRTDTYKIETLAWLKKHSLTFESLFMRPKGFNNSDHEFKKQIYINEIAPFYDIEFVIEDRSSVVQMWRELGLTCLQCDKGDF